MANLDWSECRAVESVPGKRSGAWVFRETRTPVSVVFDNLEVGASISEIMDWFHLSQEQVIAVIDSRRGALTLPSRQPRAARLMPILFDNGTPAPLRYALKGHVIVEALERGWDRLANGDLIAASEAAGFDLLLTTDKNLLFHQNLRGRKIAFVVLGNQQWPTLRRYVDRVVAAVDSATPGSCTQVEIPFE